MRKLILSVFFVLILVVSVFGFFSNVQKEQDCVDIVHEEEVTSVSTCTSERIVKTCDDTNTTCDEITESFQHKCLNTSIVKTIEKKCVTKSLTLDNHKINVEGYECSVNDNVVICDSKFDGNGDGICTSGESCMKFDFDQGSYTQYEKNSNLDFVESDESFFVDKASVEVLK